MKILMTKEEYSSLKDSLKEEKEPIFLLTAEEYISLIEDSLELGELEWGGVDNWSWYGEGREEYMKSINSVSKKKKEMSEEEYEEYIEKLTYHEIAEDFVEGMEHYVY